MNVYRSILALIVSINCTISTHATEIVMTSKWGDLKNSVNTYYKTEDDNTLKTFNTVIYHSRAGKQKLYFENMHLGNSDPCNDSETIISDNNTIIFSGQAVKMLSWCTKFNDSDSYFITYTPRNPKGQNYVINHFKNSTSPIKVEFEDDVIYIPVLGFTKVWNNAGGDAI